MIYRMTTLLLSSTLMLKAFTVGCGAVTLNGGEGPDNITGTTSSDVISARGGDDIVNGNGGDDIVDGGAGNDSITTGAGVDQVFTSTGGGTVSTGAGNDLIAVGTGMPIGQYGTQKYDNSYSLNVVDAGSGDDLVFIDNGDLASGSTIKGSLGKDRIVIGAPSGYPSNEYQNNIWSTLQGFEEWYVDGYYGLFDGPWTGPPALATVVFPPYMSEAPLGGNTIVFDNSQYIAAQLSDANFKDVEVDRITVYAGRVAVDASKVKVGSVEVRTVAGRQSPLVFLGGALKDTLIGGAGLQDDLFQGNAGDDFFDGVDGTDTAYYSGSYADYTIAELTYNTFTVRDNRAGSPDGTDTIIDVNRLHFFDQSVPLVIRGLDIVGDDLVNNLEGTEFADRLDGKASNDKLSGNAGNDTMIGGTGADEMSGGAGNDNYTIESAGDKVIEASGGGTDAITSSVSVTPMPAYVENLALTGSAALNGTGNSMNNVITGNAGANVLSGGGGSDRLIGGLGDDTYYGNTSGVPGTDIDTVSFEDRAAAVTFNLALTTLQATGGAGNDRIPNGSIENLVGGSGGDRLTGTNGPNRIEGRAGNDVIQGRLGADVLIGNGGLDVIYCGAEAVNNVDTVTYLAAGDSVVGPSRDQIVNFKPGDRISLSAIDANVKVAGNQAFTFNMTTPRANSVWYVTSGANLIVKGDVNGNTTPDFEILVKDRAGLLSADLLL